MTEEESGAWGCVDNGDVHWLVFFTVISKKKITVYQLHFLYCDIFVCNRNGDLSQAMVEK